MKYMCHGPIVSEFIVCFISLLDSSFSFKMLMFTVLLIGHKEVHVFTRCYILQFELLTAFVNWS
jgi:hypothetical protein